MILLIVEKFIHIYKTKKYNSKSTQAVDWRKRTPLHLVCIKSAPLEVIKAIVKLRKDLLLQQDYDGLLPIHHLCIERPLFSRERDTNVKRPINI